MGKISVIVRIALICIVIGDSVSAEYVPCNKAKDLKTGCPKRVCPRATTNSVECVDEGEKSYCQCNGSDEAQAPNDDRCVEQTAKDKANNCYTDPPSKGEKVEAWICPVTKDGKKTTCYKRIIDK